VSLRWIITESRGPHRETACHRNWGEKEGKSHNPTSILLQAKKEGRGFERVSLTVDLIRKLLIPNSGRTSNKKEGEGDKELSLADWRNEGSLLGKGIDAPLMRYRIEY